MHVKNISMSLLIYIITLTWIRVVIGPPSFQPSTVTNGTSDINGNRTNNLSNKLLLILLDGARWDYLYKDGLRGFPRLIKHGVHAESMVPIFPSVTVPNLYAIATGLYAENHGMPFNYMRDNSLSPDFQLSPTGGDYKVSQWWEMAEPVWITATEASIRTHLYLWPGCEVANRGRMPTYCLPYHHAFGVDEFRSHINEMMDKFENDTADFGMVYHEDIDFNGHLFGPQSDNVLRAIKDVDQVIGDMLNRLDSAKNKINIIVVSDHGMTTTNSETVSKHKLDEFIDQNDLEIVMDAGALAQIYPKENANSFQKVYSQLKSQEGYSVYTPDEIPEEYHLKRNTHRLPPILVVADKNHAISALWMTKLQVPFNPIPFDVLTGNHGYSTAGNVDMRGMFLAIGPDFKEGYRLPPINNTDVYNLAMHLLQLPPLPNNGSWESVRHMLRHPKLPEASQYLSSSSTVTYQNYHRLTLALIFIIVQWTSAY